MLINNIIHDIAHLILVFSEAFWNNQVVTNFLQAIRKGVIVTLELGCLLTILEN